MRPQFSQRRHQVNLHAKWGARSERQASARCFRGSGSARKWTGRYRQMRETGSRDRILCSKSGPRRARPERVNVISALQGVMFAGPESAQPLEMPHSTI
jgi:hypothetical protein